MRHMHHSTAVINVMSACLLFVCYPNSTVNLYRANIRFVLDNVRESSNHFYYFYLLFEKLLLVAHFCCCTFCLFSSLICCTGAQ